ncbi:MAG: hypothetical protein HRT44_01945 [Bdellovibrionales bacterium]|nr:hypothetical protein [Bdellovibrionales bacterium]NQZ18009.1 hypothetical protein [Bdellovibrionales bacterium]
MALYFMSQAYLKLEKINLAKKYISRINIQTLPTNLKSRVLRFKNSLYFEDVVENAKSLENRWSDSFSMSYGFNTNPQFISADDTTEDATSEGQLGFYANVNYLASKGDNHDWTLAYTGSGRSYASNSVSNYSTNSLNLPINFYSKDMRFQVSPNFSHVTFSGKSFSDISSLNLEVKKKLSNRYASIGTYYDYIDISKIRY